MASILLLLLLVIIIIVFGVITLIPCQSQNLAVIRDGFAPPDSAPNANDWAGTLPEFRSQLQDNVRAGSVDAALPNFSTSDAITSAAFTGMLMRALQNFFTSAPPRTT